jgi:hypothetical protein
MTPRRGGVLVSTAIAGALVACAATPERAPTKQIPERALAYAHPEPDPACRATVQESLAANALERVVVKLTRERGGGVRVLEFLEPDLTPAAEVELTRAFGECAWVPPPPTVADADVWTDSIEVTPSPPPAR